MKCPSIIENIVGSKSKSLVLSCVILLASSNALIAGQTIMSSGAICDTQEQITSFLKAVDNLTMREPLPNIEGCGMIQGNIDVTWTPVGIFESSFANAIIVKLEAKEFGTQYSYIHYVVRTDKSI